MHGEGDPAHAPTSGRNDGTAASRSTAPHNDASSGEKAPRFAASIAPGPPPVTTASPALASRCPRRAAPA